MEYDGGLRNAKLRKRGLPNLIQLFYVVPNATSHVKVEKEGIQMACCVFPIHVWF